VPDNGGRKLDHMTLEALRLRAVAQIEGGAHPEDVAGRWAAPVDGVRVGGEVPEGREGRTKGEAGAGSAPQRPGPGDCAPCLRSSHIPHMRHLRPRQGRATGDWSGLMSRSRDPCGQGETIARCQVSGGKRPAARCRRSDCGAGKRSGWPRGRRGSCENPLRLVFSDLARLISMAGYDD
jgi:hypothetical protein